jgi:hypothetical protein
VGGHPYESCQLLRGIPSQLRRTNPHAKGRSFLQLGRLQWKQHGKTAAPPANARSSPRVAGRPQPSIHAGGEKSPPAHGRRGVSPLHALHSSPLDTPCQHVWPRRWSKPPTTPRAATPSPPHSARRSRDIARIQIPHPRVSSTQLY